jgi:hypothetical protein
MRSYALLALAASARLAAAHSTVYAIFVNDVDQGVGNSAAGYIRSPPNNDPLKDVTSASMTCNVNNVATAKTVEVKSGDKVTFEWHHNSRDASDDIIDPVCPIMLSSLLYTNKLISPTRVPSLLTLRPPSPTVLATSGSSSLRMVTLPPLESGRLIL